jgi:hypothetical protein
MEKTGAAVLRRACAARPDGVSSVLDAVPQRHPREDDSRRPASRPIVRPSASTSRSCSKIEAIRAGRSRPCAPWAWHFARGSRRRIFEP